MTSKSTFSSYSSSSISDSVLMPVFSALPVILWGINIGMYGVQHQSMRTLCSCHSTAVFLKIPTLDGHPCLELHLLMERRIQDFHPIVLVHAEPTAKNPLLCRGFYRKQAISSNYFNNAAPQIPEPA